MGGVRKQRCEGVYRHGAEDAAPTPHTIVPTHRRVPAATSESRQHGSGRRSAGTERAGAPDGGREGEEEGGREGRKGQRIRRGVRPAGGIGRPRETST